MDGYQYPEELYCDQCDQDVRPEILAKEAAIERTDGLRISFSYRAALCPLCRKTLCERDYDYALVRAIRENRE